MSFSFNILVSAFHCVWPVRMCANKPDINWIWCRLLPYILCYRLLQTHQCNLHQATDPYTCATSQYKQGGLLQVYNCYRGYNTLLIWPLFSSWGKSDFTTLIPCSPAYPIIALPFTPDTLWTLVPLHPICRYTTPTFLHPWDLWTHLPITHLSLTFPTAFLDP
jgi:hypothetical protein